MIEAVDKKLSARIDDELANTLHVSPEVMRNRRACRPFGNERLGGSNEKNDDNMRTPSFYKAAADLPKGLPEVLIGLDGGPRPSART